MEKQNCRLYKDITISKIILYLRKLAIVASLVSFCISPIFANFVNGAATLTVDMENKRIVDVLNEIEKQSEYQFYYNSEFVNINRTVSVKAKNKDVLTVLELIFGDSEVDYKVVDKDIILSKKALPGVKQQKRILTGKIVDEAGEAIIGANVVVKDTGKGTISNFDGNYSLDISEGTVLQISYIGYISQELSVGNNTSLNIVLHEDSKIISEVVVVGYGTQKKVNLTGSVSSVKMDEKITNRSLTNVSSGLAGLVPGLASTQSTGMAGNNTADLKIRGLGTVNNANPLIVVDGMPDVDINRINMNDIESISVLKDATSSAVYGSRAANGVILITTKSGKNQEKTRINFSGSYAVVKPTKMTEFMADYPRALTLEQIRTRTSTRRDQMIFKDGTIDEWMAMGMIDPIRYPNTDWWDLITRDGAVQNYNLSVSGSNDKSNFYISAGVMDEKGLQ